MLLTKEVLIKVGNNSEYYKNLGYEIPMKEASPTSKIRYKKEYVIDKAASISVKVEHLPINSHCRVDVVCDYCGNLTNIKYQDYNKSLQLYGKYACSHCAKYKTKETCLSKYGVSNYTQSGEFKNKYKETCLLRYGVDNYSKTRECREKVLDTVNDKYGVDNVFQLDEIKNKSKETSIKKYGIEYASQSNDSIEKRKKTNLEKYGHEYICGSQYTQNKAKEKCMKEYGYEYYSQVPVLKEKVAKTFYQNTNKISSSQQRYICDLFEGILNYPISYYNVDIAFPDEKLICEYNGSGHWLSIKFNNVTEEQFNQKKIIRYNTVKNNGWKQMTITSRKDLLPSDSKLLELLSYSRNYFKANPNRSWIEFDIDNNIVKNALCKEGAFFDFGKLKCLPKIR